MHFVRSEYEFLSLTTRRAHSYNSPGLGGVPLWGASMGAAETAPLQEDRRDKGMRP